jgi:Ca2+-transporting ATPase
VLFGMLIFRSAPVAAVQLLWINLLTDCAPALSLSMERAEDVCMNSKPLSNIGRIFSLKSIASMLVQSIVIAAITLISYSCGYDFSDSTTAMTMAFTTLGISQILHCINNKFEGSVFGKNIFSNKFINYSVGITLFVMLFLVFTPAGYIFGLKILSLREFIIAFALSLLIIPVTEILKLATGKNYKK